VAGWAVAAAPGVVAGWAVGSWPGGGDIDWAVGRPPGP